MNQHLTPYEKAGRVFRLVAWVQVFVVIAMLAAMAIPMITERKAPPVASVMVLFLVFIPLLYFKVGKAIKEHKGWGRTAGIIIGAIMLLGFPIGTVIGAYILWCLIKGWD